MQERSSRLSVVVCTHNRASFAVDCVEALLANSPNATIDILVVDNASRAEEQDLLKQRLGGRGVTLAWESTPGLSRARNLGAELVRSEWIAYLDDDALPFPNWVENALTVTSRRGAESYGMVGGVVLPKWPDDTNGGAIEPSRIGSRWRTLLSLVDEERVARGSQIPEVVGCNMLVRRSLLQQIGGFPTTLGRTPDRILGGEEIEVARRIHASGYEVRFAPQLRVYHRIHPERLTTPWIRRRAEAEGELLWTCSPTATTAAKILLSIPYLAVASRLRALRAGSPSDYDHHVRLWNNLGYLKSALRSVKLGGKS